jgi:hypothetical protein
MDLRIGRRLETGRRSESYIYNVLFFLLSDSMQTNTKHYNTSFETNFMLILLFPHKIIVLQI